MGSHQVWPTRGHLLHNWDLNREKEHEGTVIVISVFLAQIFSDE